MCIFCGGTCGGVGDSLLPFAAAGIPLVTMKIRAKWADRKAVSRKDPHHMKENRGEMQSKEVDSKSALQKRYMD